MLSLAGNKTGVFKSLYLNRIKYKDRRTVNSNNPVRPLPCRCRIRFVTSAVNGGRRHLLV